jgi:hypothetical protein
MLPFTNFLPYFTELNRIVIKYLRFMGLSTDIYISYAMKLRKLRTLKNDNIGPRGRCLKETAFLPLPIVKLLTRKVSFVVHSYQQKVGQKLKKILVQLLRWKKVAKKIGEQQKKSYLSTL